MAPLSSHGRWKARRREPANNLPLSIATLMLAAISPWRGDGGILVQARGEIPRRTCHLRLKHCCDLSLSTASLEAFKSQKQAHQGALRRSNINHPLKHYLNSWGSHTGRLEQEQKQFQHAGSDLTQLYICCVNLL